MAALRMRASISPMGSLTMSIAPSPARLHEAGNLAGRSQFAQGDTAHLHLAIEGARPPGHQAAVADTGRGRVARQGGELQPRLEPLLQRKRFVFSSFLQSLTLGRELFHQLAD